MKVKEDDFRRELLKAINGEDLIANCTRRLGISLSNFNVKLRRARIHGIDAVLHSSCNGRHSDSFKLEAVNSVLQGMPKYAAAVAFNIEELTEDSWVREYTEGESRSQSCRIMSPAHWSISGLRMRCLRGSCC